MKLFLKCNEAAHVCDKSQYKETSFSDKIILMLHLTMCKVCRNYSKQNVKLTEAIASSKIKTLNSTEKEHLKTKLQKEFKNHPSA